KPSAMRARITILQQRNGPACVQRTVNVEDSKIDKSVTPYRDNCSVERLIAIDFHRRISHPGLVLFAWPIPDLAADCWDYHVFLLGEYTGTPPALSYSENNAAIRSASIVATI